MAIQIGKYKRPGIFLEEFDDSVISSPTVNGITNTVIGVSKRGPVNTPVLLRNINDLETVFGSLDRQLERKGSFFHRTIAKMLESSPVYAINLLLTDDTLDTIEYQTLSSSSTINNDVERLGPYRRFFDTTGFWKRDTEAFINQTTTNPGYSDRLLNLTNLSDKYVTIFIFKSQKGGFDRSLLEWYGSVEKMPPYVNSKDLASDYMVDVVIIGGDYSDYQSLAVDARFSQYFSSTGLRKDQVSNFANDRNINKLGYLEGLSLIPYFRDINTGQNIFIETVINRGTDKHGVFCAFNQDLFETDYPNGLVDLLGNNFVGEDLLANPPTSDETYYGSLDSNDGTNDGEVKINFLSYQETITESLGFTQKVLDRPGNVMALFGTASSPSVVGYHSYRASSYMTAEGGISGGQVNNTERTYWFTEDYVNDLFVSGTTVSTATFSVTVEVDQISQNGYAVIGGSQVVLDNGPYVMEVSSSYYGNIAVGVTNSYRAAYVVTSTGEVTVKQSTVANQNPLVSATDIVLGYASFSVGNGGVLAVPAPSFSDVSLNMSIYVNGPADARFKPFVYGTDYQYTVTSLSTFKVEFLNTSSSISTRDYEQYRRLKAFNKLLDYIDSSSSDKGVILVDPTEIQGSSKKYSMNYISVSDVKNTNLLNRSFVLTTTVPIDVTSNAVVEDGYVDDYFVTVEDVVQMANGDGPLVFYKLDDELILGVDGVETKAVKAVLGGMGVAANNSTMYLKYEQGQINTGDVIYQKTNYSPVTVDFVPGEGVTASLGGYDYVVFGVDLTEVDVFGNLNSDNIGANNAFFAEVDNNKGYQFLMSGLSNTGVFTTKADAGISPPPTGAGDRANILSTLSGGGYSFTGSPTYSYYAYEVNENVTLETLSNLINLFAYSDAYEDNPLYIDAHLDNTLNLKVYFEDYKLQSRASFGTLVFGDQDEKALRSNNTYYAKSFDSNFKQSVEVEYPVGYTTVPNKVLVRASRYTEVKVGDYLESTYATSSLHPNEVPRKLTRVTSKRLWSGDTTLVELTCDSEIKVNDFGNNDYQTFRHTEIDDYVSTYKAISLKGFRIRQDSLPDGTEEKQGTILNLVAKSTPLFKSITNKESFDFRYLVDSFGLGLTELSKQQLVDICGDRLDALGILNMPSVRSFKNSSSPSFVDDEGVLSVEFMAQGGDPESSPSFLYSFGEGAGVTSVGYFTPYLTVNDNGRPVDVPPAAWIATTYMRKHNSTVTSIVPWTIAAGVTNGRVTGIAGLEHDYSLTDIEFLNQAQMNPVVFKRNRGNIIETENTGQTLYNSALSYLHVREVLIELERELGRMLLDFQWKFNTPEVRSEIKLRADVICETYVSRNGLYNYFNKCDEENNTNEIIDNQIGVLDTYVEPIKGMGIIVNNVTILRTGAISSGGFINS